MESLCGLYKVLRLSAFTHSTRYGKMKQDRDCIGLVVLSIDETVIITQLPLRES